MANTAVAIDNTSAENDRSSSNLDMDPYADESILEIGKTVPITHADLASLEDVSRDLRKDPEARAAFLATFTADEEKAIMKKVDRRFFVLIGIMFMVKNIDFGNISIIKTMQAGSDSNIISELNMTPDDYNWVATIQGIPYIIFELPSNLLLKFPEKPEKQFVAHSARTTISRS
ncbi:MFS transporter prlL [Colletotrichum sp. SAR 10_99]|nr:MFS transporter prlL [Colletotrichum sp. SAR 10_99]